MISHFFHSPFCYVGIACFENYGFRLNTDKIKSAQAAEEHSVK